MKRALKLVKMVNGKAGRFVYLRFRIGKRFQTTVKPVGELGAGLFGDINLHGR